MLQRSDSPAGVVILRFHLHLACRTDERMSRKKLWRVVLFFVVTCV